MLIDTERLRLRPMKLCDLEEFTALHTDPEVTQFIRPLDRAAADMRLRRDAAEWRERGHGLLALLDRRDDTFLGECRLRYWPQFDETEVGWALRRMAWGHGYATEAGRACIDWAFAELGIPYLTAMISLENARSARLAKRLGMTPIREDVLIGKPVIVFAIERAD